MKERLESSAIQYCQESHMNLDSIRVEGAGTHIYCYFGSIEKDGYEVSVSTYTSDDSIDRIIVSIGENRAGRSLYSETREQEVLDGFLYEMPIFREWINKSLQKLENKLEVSEAKFGLRAKGTS